MSEKLKNCGNCNKLIEEHKLDLHEVYCFRNFIKCNICEVFYDKKEETEHILQHQICEICDQKVDLEYIDSHRVQCVIQTQTKTCYFCQNEFQQDLYDEHFNLCGSRTKKCDICEKPILLKEYENHIFSCQLQMEQDFLKQEQNNQQQIENLNQKRKVQQQQFAQISSDSVELNRSDYVPKRSNVYNKRQSNLVNKNSFQINGRTRNQTRQQSNSNNIQQKTNRRGKKIKNYQEESYGSPQEEDEPKEEHIQQIIRKPEKPNRQRNKKIDQEQDQIQEDSENEDDDDQLLQKVIQESLKYA